MFSATDPHIVRARIHTHTHTHTHTEWERFKQEPKISSAHIYQNNIINTDKHGNKFDLFFSLFHCQVSTNKGVN